MPRALALLSLLSLALTLVGGAVLARAAEPTVDVLEVRLDVWPKIVVRVAAPAQEITGDQVSVTEEGQAISSVLVSRAGDGKSIVSVVLAMDASPDALRPDRLRSLREATKTFLAQLRPRDRAALITFGDAVTLREPFTNDRWSLAERLDRLAPSAGPRLADALLRSAVEAGSSPPGSRAIVMMTTGQDIGSTVSLNEGINAAARSGIPVYAIALGDEPQIEPLERIANETHGRLFEARTPEDLSQAFQFVRRQVASQYDIEWTTKLQGQPGREVPVSIEVRRAAGELETLALTYKQPPFANIPAAASGPAYVPPLSQPPPLLPTLGPPEESQRLVAGVIFGVGVLLLYWALLRRTVNQRLRNRIVTHVAGIEPASGLRRVSLSPVAAWVAGLMLRFMSQGRVQAMRGKLMQAGFIADAHLRNFLAAKLAIALLVGSYGYLMVQLTGLQNASLVLGLAMAALGFLLPDFWLGRRIARRGHEIQRALPDALDMMAVGMTAGLSFDGTVMEIADKWDNALTQELSLTLSDMRLGASRRDALINLATRTGIEDIRILVTALVQADELGTSLAETLTIQAEQLRQQRKFRAEEKAHKAAVKMLIPLVGLIFPALFVVILGPAVPRLFESLGAR